MSPTDTEDLELLATERRLTTPEAFPPNDFYGSAALLKRRAGLPPGFVIRAVMPHGPSLSSRIWKNELDHPLRAALVQSAQQVELYQRQSDKLVQANGAPLFHAAALIDAELAVIRKDAAGTLIVPTHSTHHLTAEFDSAEFIAFLGTLPEEFQPVCVCLYWRDIQLGRHQQFLRAGFACTTAGHMFDPEFPFRLLRLLAAHQRVVTNRMGSSAYYAAAFDRPVLLHTQATTYAGREARFLSELAPGFDLPGARQFIEACRLPLAEAAPIQREIARREMGFEFVREPAALRALLEALPPLQECTGTTKRSGRRVGGPACAAEAAPARRRPGLQPVGPVPSPGSSCEFTVEVTTESLVERLRPIVTGHPRRLPGQVKLDGRPLAYADLHSLYHQAQQIFGQKLYDFQAATDQPVIIDGGAHIGLAALYFARRFPRGTIQAFEADPKIAAMLAANIEARGLKQVKIHARALWTTNDGVEFAATADDSGHVARAGRDDVSPSGASAKPGSVRVPSVRLRDFLTDPSAPVVDLLKLDIEGAEFAVLRDCDGALGPVRNILIEVHQFREGDGRLGELLGVLERNDFQYALGDLHAATWIESAERPPFPACRSKHYIVTVFAWQKVAAARTPVDEAGVARNRSPQVPLQPVFGERFDRTDAARIEPQTRSIFPLTRSRLRGGTTLSPEAGGEGSCGGRFIGRDLALASARPSYVLDTVLREAVAHLNAGRDAEALLGFDQAIGAGAGAQLQYGRSVALARLNRRDEAIAALSQLTQVDPTHARARALADDLEVAGGGRLYIASYPRSGNTWLRLLLSDVILQLHGHVTGTTLPIHADQIIPDLHGGKPEDVDRRLRLPCVLLKSHDRWDKLAPGRAVCLVRQAADALVSYFHFHRRYPHLAPKVADGVDAFCHRHVGHWRAHLESFLEARGRGVKILFVAYESFHAAGAQPLGRVARFIGLPADDAICRRAVEHHTFARQQAAELQAHGDKYAVPFFRQGQVNGATAELSPETLSLVHSETDALYQAALA